MPVGSNLSAVRNYPEFSGVVMPTFTPATLTLTTGGGAQTMTAAQALSGIVLVDCQDAQTLTLPTAALLQAAIAGLGVGLSVAINVLNYGDTTLTIALGAGITNKAVGSIDAILTIATFTARTIVLVCTAVKNDVVQGSAAAFDLYVTAAGTVAS